MDTAKILIRTNELTGIEKVSVVLHARGMFLFEQEINTTEPYSWLKIPKKNIPSGIIVCTLFDQDYKPLAERLFFNFPEDQSTNVDIAVDSILVGKRKKSTVHLTTPTSTKFEGGKDKFSLSIIPTTAHLTIKDDDIRMWMLLNSDLQNPIDHSIDFSNANPEDRNTLIDNILMTRGWRRFRWDKLKEQDEFIAKYKLEEGIYLNGRLSKWENPNVPRMGKVFFHHLEDAIQLESVTDEDGNFSFGPFVPLISSRVYLQGRFKASRKSKFDPNISLNDNPHVHLHINKPGRPNLDSFQSKIKLRDNQSSDNYRDISMKSMSIAQDFDSLTIELSEVEIQAQKISIIEERRNERTFFYRSPDKRLIPDSLPGANNSRSLFDLLRFVPGVLVTGGTGQESVVIRGPGSFASSNTPLFVYDGMPVDQDFFQGMFANSFEFVDVLKGARTAIFGSRGANGVILVYSKEGESMNPRANQQAGFLTLQLEALHEAREFAVFDSNLTGNQNRPDIRTTLHWNPSLSSDETGSISESFTTSDQSGKYIIIVQGISKDGMPLYGSRSIELRN